jgi:hypothetical protein
MTRDLECAEMIKGNDRKNLDTMNSGDIVAFFRLVFLDSVRSFRVRRVSMSPDAELAQNFLFTTLFPED